MKVEVSKLIDRPVATVWDFYAVNHDRNHPRWDPDIEFEQESDDPIGVGTVLRRRNSRSGTPVERTMEVVEYQPERAMRVVTHDGPMRTDGRATFEAQGPDGTLLTISADMPWMDESMDPNIIASLMDRSLQNIKKLIESES